MMGRQAAEDVTLGDGRVRVRAGEIVIMSTYVVQRDPRWWAEPLAFRPERFAHDAPKPVPFAYFPFGAGKRACIGRSFAQVEAAMLIATIVRRVDLEIDTRRPIGLQPLMTLRPAGGVPAIVRHRAAAVKAS
jgi:cytochrome P450